MGAIIFVREDLLKASHYKTINVKGHMHGGHWQDAHAARVLVSDDHDDEKVSTGQGSFYQKQAHKKLGEMVDGFHAMAHFDKAGIILKHATKMQQDASASAALSGFKSSMMAGKVPLPAQFFAMQNAPSNAQGKVADACAAAIGDDKYEKLLFAASAKANKTKGKTSEPKTPQAVKTKPQGQTQGAPAGEAAKPAAVAQPGTTGQAAVEADLPPNVKAKLDDWAVDGYVDRLQDAADDHGSSPAYQAYAKQLLVQFKPIQDAVASVPDFSAMASAPVPENIKAVIDKIASMPTGDSDGAKALLGQVVANNAHNPHIAAYAAGKLAMITVPNPGPASKSPTAIPLHTFTGDGLESYVSHGTGKMAGQFSVSLKDTDAGQFVPSVTFYPNEAEAIKSAKSAAGVKDDPKDGDTKPGSDGSNLVFKNGRWHKYVDADESGELPPVLVPVADDASNASFDEKMQAIAAANAHASDAASVAAMEGGSYYQKEAVKKLKAEHGPAWDAIHPSKQHELAHAKYQVLQGAASQAAAVSGWKKHMLAGQVPTPSEVKAMAAFDTATPDKAVKVMNEVQAAIGADKYVQLVTQAHAKAAKAPAAAPAAKVFVTTPPVVAAKPVTLADKPAYDHMGQSVSSKMSHSLPAQKTFHKLAAQDWMAANPDKGAEMYEALASLKLSHLAAAVGPGVHPAATPSAAALGGAAKPVNDALSKFSGNTPVKEFVQVFKIHGGPAAGSLSIDQLLDPDQIKAFQKLDSLGKMDVAAAISFYGPHKLKLFAEWLSAHNAKATKPAGPVPVVSQVFNNTQPGHNKFWSVSTHGTVMKTTYGKIGTQGSTTTKVFASPDAAIIGANKLKDEKVAKGYKYGGSGTHVHDAVSTPSAPFVPAAPVLMVAKVPSFEGTVLDNDTTYFVQKTADKFLADSGKTKQAYDEVLSELQSKGYGHLVSHYKVLKGMDHPGTQNEPIGAVAIGPKDGDTKPGADGTLVFKDGHWHKVKVKKFTQKAAKELVFSKFGGSMNTNSSGKMALQAAAAADAPGIVAAYNKALASGFNNTASKIKFLAQEMGVSVDGTQAAPGAATPALQPAAAAQPVKVTVSAPKVKFAAGKPPVTVIDGWAQTGTQKGSNPGGKFKDKSGQEWYCKFPADIDVAMNELLAAKFYQMLGVSVPTLKLVEQGGKVGIASKWVDGISVGTAAQLAKAPGAHQAFALDAWLANWDVVGMSNDNLMLDKKGAAVRVDVGGSLVYRAMGGKKGDAFGDTVPELDTLKDAKTNDKSAAVFGKVKDADMAWGLGQLNKMKPSQIEELCQKVGPGLDADKAALAKKLIARRAFILAKMGVRDQWTHVKALDPTKLPVNQADLPKPIQFKASSKEHVNAQNTKDSEALIAFASKGNLTALKDYMYDAVDKETSAPLGKKSILDHPSKPLKEQWAGLVELLQSISTPPMPTLELPSLGSIGDLEDISAFVGTFSPEARVETVASEHRMHFFMALSHIDDISGLVADMKWSFLKSAGKFVKDAKAKHSSLSSAVKGYISAVQSSGSINHSWSQGKTTVSTGGNSVGIHGLTANIYAEAQELPEGTTLIRGMSDTSSGKSMCNQLLACAPGTVIQNTDSMCASYNESHSWGGDVQMTIRCAKGCKATLSFATGKYGGEHEITTLPGQRFVVLSTKKVNGTVHLEVLMLPPHEGFVSELTNLSALGKAMSVIFVRGR